MEALDCLDGDSIVLKLVNGTPIPVLLSTIQEGDQLLGLSGTYETVKLIELKIRERILIQSELGEIICSKSHTFFSYKETKIVEAKASDIRKGTILVTRNNGYVIVKNIKRIRKGLVYSLQLTGPHHVYVCNGLLHRANT